MVPGMLAHARSATSSLSATLLAYSAARRPSPLRAVDRMPTSVDDLVEVAELAERLLLAATDPDDVGELLSAVTASWAKGGRRR